MKDASEKVPTKQCTSLYTTILLLTLCARTTGLLAVQICRANNIEEQLCKIKSPLRSASVIFR